MNHKQLVIILLAMLLVVLWGLKIADERWGGAASDAALPAAGVPEDLVAPVEEEKLPRIALVLDDFGYTKRNLKKLEAIGAPFTIAVLPNAPYSRVVSEYASDNGIETILHLPMEPEGKDVELEKGTIMTGMEPGKVVDTMERAFRDVPSATGVSNHQGSRATRDEKTMDIVLAEIRKKGLYYLDSLTTGGSVCGKVAGEKKVPYIRRDLFLDDKNDDLYIKGQMEKAVEIARRYGYAVVIGHERAATLKVLREAVPGLEEKGVKFVHLSEIVVEENKKEGSK